LKVIEAYEKHWKPRRRRHSKAFDGMDQHNAWDFETQYKQILFKLKLEDFKLKVKPFGWTAKTFVSAIFDQPS
jgi:ATP-binding cassette subfamily F protein uup